MLLENSKYILNYIYSPIRKVQYTMTINVIYVAYIHEKFILYYVLCMSMFYIFSINLDNLDFKVVKIMVG